MEQTTSIQAVKYEEINMPTRKDLDRFRGDIGETLVAYELMKRGWDVMKHLGGLGYDLLATKRLVTRRIEVKATDPALKTGKTRGQLTQILSETELRTADFCASDQIMRPKIV